MLNKIAAFGQVGLRYCENLGRSGLFLLQTLVRKPNFKENIALTIEQIFSVGVLSLIIIVISGLFIGMVVGLQGFNTLEKFGATQQLGQLLALSVVRELGPVVTALLFAGRAGSSLTAEIGLMKATDQLASMDMMGVDPLRRVIAPRLWGGFFAMPILALIFNAVAILGGYLVGVAWLGLDAGSFWSNMQAAVNFRVDILSGIIKSIVFGFIVTWIAVYQGFACQPTSAGIARATTNTVVYASLAILGLDFILTAVMLGSW
ncbi:MAG: lipid asymmetry maintenance ABC transporter permease subunit MlaE [Pseudomonadota bacterium]